MLGDSCLDGFERKFGEEVGIDVGCWEGDP